jgi:hypothetical protein
MPENLKPSALDRLNNADFAGLSQKNEGVYLGGTNTSFDAKEVGRYTSYGSAVYGKLGYDPTKDNNKIYNANTTGGQDIARAFTGMWKLAGVGFKDTFAFGATASDNAHKDFEEVMNRYSSTRGGSSGFISNTMLSSGYTIGIMGAIAAEEAGLALGTALTGGLAGGVQVAETASLLGRAGKLLDKVGDSVNVFKKLSNVKNARTLNWIGKQGNSVTKGLLPMGESFDFLRNYDKLSDLNSLGKTLTGAGAIARDARKIYMTTSESKLEANMAKDEVRNELLDKWNKQNPGKVITDGELSRIDKTSTDVFNDVYKSNLGLIYVTNAITFNTMFKSMRHVNKAFKIADSLGMTIKKNAGKIAVDAVDDSVISLAKKKLSQVTVKSALKWTATSSMEGVQEVGQDAISEAAKGYNLGMHEDAQFKGSYYEGLAKAMTHINPETFFSGMLMGTFAAPVGHAIKGFNQMTQGGGYRQFSDSEGWAAEKKSAFETKKTQAKILTELFNRTGTFLEVDGKPQAAMSGYQEKMLEAAEKGDRKFFEDTRSSAFRVGVKALFKNGMDAELISHLEDMQGYSAEELNQAMDRTDITEDNKSEHLQKVRAYSERIKSYKSEYDRIETEHVNPVNLKALSNMDPSSKEYMQYMHAYHANEAYKDELLFSGEKIADFGNRMKVLSTGLTANNGMTTSEVSHLVSASELNMEISRLTTEVANNKEYKTEDPQLVKKLEAMKAYHKALVNYDTISDPETNFEVQKEMREAFDNYRNAVLDRTSSIPNSIDNGKHFDLLWDYMNIGDERKVLQDHVNTLLDPLHSIRFVERMTDTLAKRDANKEKLIFDSLKAFEERSASNAMMESLLGIGVIFDMNEIDDLIKRGIMPDKFFDVKTNEEIKGERLKEAYAIIASRYKKLTGKKIIASDTAYAGRSRSESDERTAAQLVTKFGGGKKNTPIKVSTFINRLLKSPELTLTERSILLKLQENADTMGTIQLTTDSDTMISFAEDGTVAIDVRFGGSDFHGTIPFEYVAVSALLQIHLADNMSPELTKQAGELMAKTKEAYLERHPNATAQELKALGFFDDVKYFLGESLSNVWLQDLMTDVEDVTSAEQNTLWDGFEEVVAGNLGRTFEGSILRKAIKLAQLAVTDEAASIIAEEPAIAAAEEEPVVENTDDLKTRGELQIELIRLEKALIAKQKELKGISWLRKKAKRVAMNEVFNLRNQVVDKQAELNSLKKDEPVGEVIPVAQEVNTETQDEQEEDGSLIIGKNTEFTSLPQDLQIALAKLYIGHKLLTDPVYRKGLEAVLITMNPGMKSVIENNQATGFEQAMTLISDEQYLQSLDEKDIKIIEGRIGTSIDYIKLVGAHNLNTTAAEVEPTPAVIPAVAPIIAPVSGPTVGAVTPVTGPTISDPNAEINALKEELKQKYENKIASIDPEEVRKRRGISKFGHSLLLRAIDEIKAKFKEEYERELKALEQAPITPKIYTTADVEAVVPAELFKELSEDQVLYFIDKLNKDEFELQEVVDQVATVKKQKARQASKRSGKKVKAPVDNKLSVDYSKYNPNIKLLNSGATAFIKKGTGKKDDKWIPVRWPKGDIPYMKYMFDKELREMTPEEFKAFVISYVQNVKILAKSLNLNGVARLDIEDPNQQADAINNYIKELESNNELSLSVVNAINKHLDNIKSPFVVKPISKSKKFLNPFRAVKRGTVVAKSVKVDSIGAQLAYYFTDRSNVSQDDVDFYKLYDWLTTHKVHPDALNNQKDKARKKNLWNVNSEYNSFDGIANEVFADELDRLQDSVDSGKLADLVDETLKNYDSVKEMRQYLIDRMEDLEKQKNDEYDEREQEEEEDPELNDMQRALYEFEGSDAYAILTGQYEGDIDSLSISDRQLHNQIYGDSYIQTGRSKAKEADVMAKEIWNTLDSSKSQSFQLVEAYKKRINNPETSLVDLVLVATLFNQTPNISQEQEKMFWDIFQKSIQSSDFTGEFLILKGKVVKVVGTQKFGVVEVQDFETQKTRNVSVKDFALGTEKFLGSTGVFSISKLNTKAEPETIDPVKISYQYIFDNFTESMDQYKELPDAELKIRIKEQLSKCK